MGDGLFNDFRELTSQADTVLGYSIEELCIQDAGGHLGQTDYTQPALYVVNAFTYLKKIALLSRKPDFVAGHSLGEYNALLAAEVFDFETGLRLVKKRGELMSRALGGGMAAVIGLTDKRVEELLRENHCDTLAIANYNAPSQVVISGPKAEIDQAGSIFEAAGARAYIPLRVSGAFHSQFMEEARENFFSFLEEFEFSGPKIPVISNVTARPYTKEDIRQLLADQITHPVKWTACIRYLLGQGETEFEEIGPGTVLTGLIQQIKKEAQPLGEAGQQERREKQKTKQARAEEVWPKITAASLGSEEFKQDYNVRYAYVTGGMYRGIASKELVVRMGKAGLMGYFGTGGLDPGQIEAAIHYIQRELKDGQAYGMNLLSNIINPNVEEETIDLFLRHGVKNVEAAAFMQITPPLVKYRLKGLSRDAGGNIAITHRVQAKVSRPEVARAFLSPAPEHIVRKLLAENKITREQADLSTKVPMADDLCVEADSGGHTDQGVAYVLMPAMMRLRDELMDTYKYPRRVRVGAAGGIGTPEAVMAAFMLGADFILTGSVNQCTVEAGTSGAVKDLLQQINVQDTDYAPAGDMFELGAKVQVLKKGVFFPARANKLYELYRQYNSLDEIDEKTKKQIQEKYFQRSFEDIYKETKAYFSQHYPQEIEKAERNPKHKMALVFRWYFGHTTHLALSGSEEQKVDYQVHCGPALGAFNQWVKGTPLENWSNRHVDEIAEKLMQEAAELLNHRFQSLFKRSSYPGEAR